MDLDPAAGRRAHKASQTYSGAEGSFLLPLGKYTFNFSMDSEQRGPWKIVAIFTSCDLLPSMGRCPLQVSYWAGSSAKRRPGTWI